MLGVVALVGLTVGTLGIGGPVIAALATTIGTIAGVAAGIANIASQALAKPPPARGSVSQMIVDPNAPQPYAMGEGYTAGVLRHRAGYGATIDDVPNPYLFDAVVYSGGGPVESISPRIDYATVPAWYSGYLTTDTQLGECPESAALTASFGTPTGWSSSHKLSGLAAIGWNFKFDKTGKKFSAGLPLTGAYGQWVKVYDPRLDSTFPGGSGVHRIDDEDTWEWSENPALHAGTYAYGRFQNGKHTIGIGLPADGIDWAVIADWANVCDANAWTIFGIVYEPGDKWANLKDICAAGGAEPVPGPVLTFRYATTHVALDTVTEADIADEDMSVCAMQSYRDRINEVRPRYRSPDHNWELVQAEAITVSEYVTEDGEVRPIEWPFNFVKNEDQAAQLAAYRLVDARELFPIEIKCKPRLRGYRPGDCLHLDLPQLGLDHDCIILRREFDPGSMTVKFTLMSETPEKHAYALGLTGVAPPTPALGQTAEERDEIAGAVAAVPSADQLAIRNAGPENARAIDDTPRDLMRADEIGTSGFMRVSVARHDWNYPDREPVTRELDVVTTLDDGVTDIPPTTRVYLYFDDATLGSSYSGTPLATTYGATLDPAVAINSADNPARHPIGYVDTPAAGSAAVTTGGKSIGYGFVEV